MWHVLLQPINMSVMGTTSVVPDQRSMDYKRSVKIKEEGRYITKHSQIVIISFSIGYENIIYKLIIKVIH